MTKKAEIRLPGGVCFNLGERPLGGCPRIAQAVIPAKAGICKYLKRLDSRLHGND